MGGKTTYWLTMCERVRACRDAGMTIQQAADHLRCSYDTVHKYAHEGQIKFKKPSNLEDSDWPLIKALLADGMYFTHIQKKFNVGYYTLKRFITEHQEDESII